MNILVFSFFPAYVPASNGGESRLYSFYKELSKYHNVTLLSSAHVGGEEEKINHGVNFSERRIPKDHRFYDIWQHYEAISSGGDISAPCIAELAKYPTLMHDAYLEEYEVSDVIIHDSPFMIGFDLFARCDSKLRIYNSYNCEYSLYKQLHPSSKSSEILDVVRAVEQKTIDCVDVLSVCSEVDIEKFSEVYGTKTKTKIIPHGIELKPSVEKEPNTTHWEDSRLQTVFLGSGHPPNVEAANFIVEELAPKLVDVDFHILGSCLKGEVSYPKNVHNHGFVDADKKQTILDSCSLALNPMISGSGASLKILDFFSAGLPVLSTKFGMRGIDAKAGKHFFEADKAEFSESIQSLNNQREQLCLVGQAGRTLVNNKYTWTSIVAKAEKWIKIELEKNKKNVKPKCLVLNDYNSFSGVGGGATRTRGLYSNVEKYYDILFVCFSENNQLLFEKFSDSTTVIQIPKTDAHISELVEVNSQFHVSADDIVASRNVLKNTLFLGVYEKLKRNVSKIIIEHPYMGGLPIAFGDSFIYSSQNNESELKARLLVDHPQGKELVDDTVYLESLVLNRASLTIAVSEEDAYQFSEGKSGGGPVCVVRNGAGEAIYNSDVDALKSEIKPKISESSVVFLGSAHMPNIQSAQYILEVLAPSCENIDFHIIGSACDALSSKANNVILWGIVNEEMKCAIMQSCKLALNPMLSGSGSNVKLADYLSNGLFCVSTDFGVRGYPKSITPHTTVCDLDDFASTIAELINNEVLFSSTEREKRLKLFNEQLAMKTLANKFSDLIKKLDRPRKKILYVAYRYGYPELGGAEVNLEKFIRHLSNTGEYDIDIVAPKVSHISSVSRFSESYSYADDFCAPIDMPNVNFYRFSIDESSDNRGQQLIEAWYAQPKVEKNLSDGITANYSRNGVTWGWGEQEGEERILRWAFLECGLFVTEANHVQVSGYTPREIVTTVYQGEVLVAGPFVLSGSFIIDFDLPSPGNVEIFTSGSRIEEDCRPLGALISSIIVGNAVLDLTLPTLIKENLFSVRPDCLIDYIHSSSENCRNGLSLTDIRGPFSSKLENYVRDHVHEYNLVLTNNNVFKPAVYAIDCAKNANVPTILIPHAHLDDDFYHFPDFIESCQQSDLVLAVPQGACDFLESKGCNVEYMPAGCDVNEAYSDSDLREFEKVWDKDIDFILCLGRKSPAKGYSDIISAIEEINRDGTNLHLVMIGPDDDGAVINSKYVTYLGRQPREVLRGALMKSLTLCNMSSSESFGIVLFEAWLAGKPVVVNQNCMAFQDFAVHEENALLVNKSNLASELTRIVKDERLRDRLANKGKSICDKYSWDSVCYEFEKKVSRLINGIAHLT